MFHTKLSITSITAPDATKSPEIFGQISCEALVTGPLGVADAAYNTTYLFYGMIHQVARYTATWYSSRNFPPLFSPLKYLACT